MPMDDLFDISQITGNASDNIKHAVGHIGGFFKNRRVKDLSTSIFGESILNRMKVVEVSLNRKAEEEEKMEARVVVEVDVTEGQHIVEFICLKPVTYCVCVRHVERRRKYSWRVFCIPCRYVSSGSQFVIYLLTQLYLTLQSCSTLALVAFSLENSGSIAMTVSQSLNIIYHSPAQL